MWRQVWFDGRCQCAQLGTEKHFVGLDNPTFLTWLLEQNKTLAEWCTEKPEPDNTPPPPTIEERLAKLESDVTALKATRIG